MPNITLAIDKKILVKSREYARKYRTSINAIVRKTLSETVETKESGWLKECFALMDKTHATSKGKKWKRADLYD